MVCVPVLWSLAMERGPFGATRSITTRRQACIFFLVGTLWSGRWTENLNMSRNANSPLTSLSYFFSGNHIFQGQAAGIAINENGRGMITGVCCLLIISLCTLLLKAQLHAKIMYKF